MRPFTIIRKPAGLPAIALLACAVLACSFAKLLSTASMFEGKEMQEAAAEFKKKIGGPVKALSLEIENDTATLRAQNPKNPEHVDQYKYAKGFTNGPNPVQLNSLERNLDKTLFDLDEVNLAATADVARAALSRTNLEGGKVTKIVIERGLSLTSGSLIKSGEVRWTITVQGTRESAEAVANAKGEMIGVDLSQTSRAANVNYYEGDTMQEAAPKIKEAFGGKAKVLDFIIYDKYAWFKAPDPKKPDEINQYKFDINGLSRGIAVNPMELKMLLGPQSSNLKIEDLLFDLDEIDFSKTAELARATPENLKMSGARVSSMKISRGSWAEMRTSREVKWEVSVRDARQRSSFAVYDAKGNLKRTKAAE